MVEQLAPIIAIDGPSGSGKGTISRLVANELKWNFLDSGALYRLVALAAKWHSIPLDDEQGLGTLAGHLDVEFSSTDDGASVKIFLEGEEVSDAIRREEVGNNASRVATVPLVRDALLARQRAFRQAPGLVADGRDMGTVVFPDAQLKIFLTASVEERAQRRYKQLNEKGVSANLNALFEELEQRDKRDRERAVAPLVAAPDAIVVDSSGVTIDEVMMRVMGLWRDACR